ncbi:MAG: hypothetical protein M3355_06840 [Actinomycetota bacterium]|nr:hypothetical protein [Actinomycetota bacterium]
MTNDEVWVGDSLLSFDGRVFEIFGYHGQDSIRYHARNLVIDIGDPNKKGKLIVQLKPRTRGMGCALEISSEDWAHAAPLLERLQAAAGEGGIDP